MTDPGYQDEGGGGGRRVLVSGSSGLIGRALTSRLATAGHSVTRLVRSDPGPGRVLWDPAQGKIDGEGIEGHDWVVHLAGAGIGEQRWDEARKRVLVDSRVAATDLLARTLASLKRPPQVLASGSAMGFYGDRGDEEVDETSAPGAGFLADLVVAWEAATQPLAVAGCRVAHLRTGVVLSAAGGALGELLGFFRLGLGGRIGSGRHWMSWISRADEVSAILHVLTHEELSGAVNLVAPEPVTNAEFTRALGRALDRPAFLAVPPAAVRLRFGPEMTTEMIMASTRVRPGKLQASGFGFAHPNLGEAFPAILKDT
ncbi:MAG: TIGR01777 family oxidoreductase [Acidimicrobiales bacterium]